MVTEITILNENELNFTKIVNKRLDEPDFKDDAFYVCDLGDVYQKYKHWVDKLPRVKLFYAVKSNNCEVILKLFVSLDLGFDCASKHEMELLLNLGITPDRIIYSQPVKLLSHLLAAKNYDVKLTVFDGYDEIIKIKHHFPAAKLMLRIRMDALQCINSLGVKSGCDPDTDGKKLIEAVAKEGLNLIGIMFHVGSGCMEHEVFDRAIKKSRELFDFAKQFGIKCSTVNVGGGFIGDSKNWHLFNDAAIAINNAIDKYFADLTDVEFMAEPGRYFCSESTIFASHVHSRRVIRDESDNVKEFMYYMSDGIYGPFNTQFASRDPYIIKLLKTPEDSKTYSTSLWGPSCNSRDFIFKDIQLPELFLNDWLIFEYTGSYSFVLSSDFNGFQKAPIYFYITSTQWAEIKDKYNSVVKLN